MRGIGGTLQIASRENRPWREALADYVIRYNYQPLASTNEKPIELLHNRRVKGLMPFNGSSRGEAVDSEAARDRDRVEKLKGAQYANLRRGEGGSKGRGCKAADQPIITNTADTRPKWPPPPSRGEPVNPSRRSGAETNGGGI
jgi:hypothetical protein